MDGLDWIDGRKEGKMEVMFFLLVWMIWAWICICFTILTS